MWRASWKRAGRMLAECWSGGSRGAAELRHSSDYQSSYICKFLRIKLGIQHGEHQQGCGRIQTLRAFRRTNPKAQSFGRTVGEYRKRLVLCCFGWCAFRGVVKLHCRPEKCKGRREVECNSVCLFPCFALRCCAVTCFALLCFALLCFALLGLAKVLHVTVFARMLACWAWFGLPWLVSAASSGVVLAGLWEGVGFGGLSGSLPGAFG